MADHPILFSAPMVRAIIAGRKIQTRRIINSVRTQSSPPVTLTGDRLATALDQARDFRRVRANTWQWAASSGKVTEWTTWWLAAVGYAPGDRLWVRETLRQAAGEPSLYAYAADGELVDLGEMNFPVCADGRRVIPSIHMPRFASRLTLTILDARIQRLQDMEGQHWAESDAIAEGVMCIHHGDGDYYYSAMRDEPHPQNWCDPTDAFAELWNSTYGAGAWAANPWVVAYTFDVERLNIDAAAIGTSHPPRV